MSLSVCFRGLQKYVDEDAEATFATVVGHLPLSDLAPEAAKKVEMAWDSLVGNHHQRISDLHFMNPTMMLPLLQCTIRSAAIVSPVPVSSCVCFYDEHAASSSIFSMTSMQHHHLSIL